jgi:hypothetical protein
MRAADKGATQQRSNTCQHTKASQVACRLTPQFERCDWRCKGQVVPLSGKIRALDPIRWLPVTYWMSNGVGYGAGSWLAGPAPCKMRKASTPLRGTARTPTGAGEVNSPEGIKIEKCSLSVGEFSGNDPLEIPGRMARPFSCVHIKLAVARSAGKRGPLGRRRDLTAMRIRVYEPIRHTMMPEGIHCLLHQPD